MPALALFDKVYFDQYLGSQIFLNLHTPLFDNEGCVIVAARSQSGPASCKAMKN